MNCRLTVSVRRDGSSLALVVVVMLVLDCVILGTLHLAMLERGLAANATQVLRLRFAAEGAAATALTPWQSRFDSLQHGVALEFPVQGPDGGVLLTAAVERIGDALLHVRATATLPPPAGGRATAAALFLPPVLPDGMQTPEAVLRALAAAAMLRDRAGVAVLDPGAVIDSPLTGVVIALGAVEVRSAITGVLLAGGPVYVAAGAVVSGAIASIAAIEAQGTVEVDDATAAAAVRSALLTRATPAPSRPALPAF
jgi:hypothetical protein